MILAGAAAPIPPMPPAGALTPLEQALLIAGIAALAALAGSAVGGCVTYRVAKGNWDRDRERVREEVTRQTTSIRREAYAEVIAAWDEWTEAIRNFRGDKAVTEGQHRFTRANAAAGLVAAEPVRGTLTRLWDTAIALLDAAANIGGTGDPDDPDGWDIGEARRELNQSEVGAAAATARRDAYAAMRADVGLAIADPDPGAGA